MKFVALLSGGKDSVYCIEKCLKYGHELLCVANLHPPPEASRNGDEINSYMYQSAAFTAIPTQAECLGVPLVRREILGKAMLQSLNYEVTENDEVEDLFQLLKDVKSQFPDIKGVSCGAIISNYQRFRVENACQRLGLIPLAYLWQRDRHELLQEMLNSGLKAVIVKTAGAGLVPDKHLGKTLNEMYPILQRLHERFELDYCGEGGEYESLVLDSAIFKKSLVLTETVIDYDDEDYSVGCLRVVACETLQKEQMESKVELLDEELQLHTKKHEAIEHRNTFASLTAVKLEIPLSLSFEPNLFIGKDGLCQTGLLVSSALSKNPLSPESQLRTILESLSLALSRRGCDLKDAVYVHLYVGNMSHFKEINDEYGKWFGINPPSRSCIQCCLPSDVHVALDCLILHGSHDPHFLGVKNNKKEILHVRSISNWAPVCIGPYAQANVILDSVILVAGQIALLPHSMELLDDFKCTVVHYHCPLIDIFMKKQYNLTEAIRPLYLRMIPELFLSLSHVNSILSALAGNEPTAALSPSSTLMIIIYIDVHACAAKHNKIFNETNHDQVIDDVHSLFQVVRACAIEYVRMFVPFSTVRRGESASSSEDHIPDSDSDDNEPEILINDVPLPVMVLGVTGLPRGAIVEVEVMGATAALQRRQRKTVDDFIDTQVTQQMPSMTIVTEAVVFEKFLCCGIFSLVPCADGESHALNVNSWIVADIMVLKLKSVLAEADLQNCFLRMVKLFVCDKYHNLFVDLEAAVVRAIGKILNNYEIDPIVIPVTHLESQNVLAVQFFGVNFAEAELENSSY